MTKKTQNGHAWNSVVLDGEEYYCDLTWDAPNIQMNNYPLEYCLCNGETFGHEVFKDKHKFEVKRICYRRRTIKIIWV